MKPSDLTVIIDPRSPHLAMPGIDQVISFGEENGIIHLIGRFHTTMGNEFRTSITGTPTGFGFERNLPCVTGTPYFHYSIAIHLKHSRLPELRSIGRKIQLAFRQGKIKVGTLYMEEQESGEMQLKQGGFIATYSGINPFK